MNKLLQIRKEFDEPFIDVVKGFAEMGYSRAATAKILEFNLSYFRQLRTRFDLHRHFKPFKDLREDCRSGGGRGWPKGRARPRRQKYTDEQLLAEVRKYPNFSLFTTMADVDMKTIYRRFGSFTEARRLAVER